MFVLLCLPHRYSNSLLLYPFTLAALFSHLYLASSPALLKVQPSSIQHLQGEFSLHCSGRDGKTEGWTLRCFPGAGVNSSCVEMGGRFGLSNSDKCSFNNITAGLSGLYWCKADEVDQPSNAINITVSGELCITNTSLFNNRTLGE